MTSTCAGSEDWNCVSRQIGAAWIELRAPARVSWMGELGAECRVEAIGKPVSIPILRFTALLQQHEDGESPNTVHAFDHVDHPVRLGAGGKAIFPVTGEIRRSRGMLAQGQLSLLALGGWRWPPAVTMTVPF